MVLCEVVFAAFSASAAAIPGIEVVTTRLKLTCHIERVTSGKRQRSSFRDLRDQVTEIATASLRL